MCVVQNASLPFDVPPSQEMVRFSCIFRYVSCLSITLSASLTICSVSSFSHVIGVYDGSATGLQSAYFSILANTRNGGRPAVQIKRLIAKSSHLCHSALPNLFASSYHSAVGTDVPSSIFCFFTTTWASPGYILIRLLPCLTNSRFSLHLLFRPIIQHFL